MKFPLVLLSLCFFSVYLHAMAPGNNLTTRGNPLDNSNNSSTHDQNMPNGIRNKLAIQTKMGDFTEDFCKSVELLAPEPVRKLITRLNNFECDRRYTTPYLLLYGPSGSGKSTISQVIAQRIKRPLTFIRTPLLGTVYRNSAVQNLSDAVDEACRGGHVVVLDEVDYIAKASSREGDDLDRNIAGALWELLDVCKEYPKVIVIGTTNNLKGMPEQLRTRFKEGLIEIPCLTTASAKAELLKFHLGVEIYEGGDEFLAQLARKVPSFSQREIESLVRLAAISAFDRHGQQPPMVKKQDFWDALAQLQANGKKLDAWDYNYKEIANYTIQAANFAISCLNIYLSSRASNMNFAIAQDSLALARQTYSMHERYAQLSYETSQRALRAQEESGRIQRVSDDRAQRDSMYHFVQSLNSDSGRGW